MVVMVLSLVSLAALVAAFAIPAGAALRHGADSRRDDGRPNW